MSSAEKQQRKAARKLPGKDQGLTFWQCFAKDRLYTKDMPGIRPYLYIIPFFLAYFVLDFSLRYTYRSAGIVGVRYLPAFLFTLGWALVFAGLVFCLPKVPRWFVRCVPLVTFVTIAVTHSGFMSMFRRFFSFSVLTYGGTGSFMQASYIHIALKVVAGATVTVLLMMTSGRLLKVIPPKPVKLSVILGLVAAVLGAGIIAFTNYHFFPVVDTVVWDNAEENTESAAYHEFSDTTNSLKLCGLYQYTMRDLVRQIFPANTMSDDERQQVEDYIATYEQAKTDNEYTGLLKGKNVIMVQLEALDTWMLQPEYMPNLSQLKSESIAFTNHYTPAYITAGTFNTEFMANTSLLPATGGIPTSVYTDDNYPFSLANLFRKAGYTARSFHNSEGNVYDRENIHRNLGYEKYYGGQYPEHGRARAGPPAHQRLRCHDGEKPLLLLRHHLLGPRALRRGQRHLPGEQRRRPGRRQTHRRQLRLRRGRSHGDRPLHRGADGQAPGERPRQGHRPGLLRRPLQLLHDGRRPEHGAQGRGQHEPCSSTRTFSSGPTASSRPRSTR